MRQGERPRFEEALLKLLYASNGDRSVPKQHRDTYWNTLKRYGLADVLRAMQEALQETDSHVTPANLLKRVRPTTSFEESRNPAVMAERTAPKRDAMAHWNTMSEFERMSAQASVAFARRICDRHDSPVKVPEPRVQIYDGPFDYMPAVMAAPLPEGSTFDEHAECWGEMRRILRHEWSQR